MNDDDFNRILQSLEEAALRVEAAIRRVPNGRWEEVIHTGDGAWTRASCWRTWRPTTSVSSSASASAPAYPSPATRVRTTPN